MASGAVTLSVSPQDVEAVAARPWYAHRSPAGKVFYASHGKKGEGLRGLIYLGRFILELAGVTLERGQRVIHLNGDTRDARRCNLLVVARGTTVHRRIAPKEEDAASTSSYIGVSQVIRKGAETGRWFAKIKLWLPRTHRSRTFYLGTYDTEEEAALAYDLAATAIHGKAARTNASAIADSEQ